MAKYTRFDPRNKKKSRNKMRSIEKDIRISRLATEDKSFRTKDYLDWVDNEHDDKEEAHS